jgi:FMN phosphatase YigB (HAD superfamily)
MVGDTLEADVRGALAAGSHACHLLRDGRPSPAEWQVRSLTELLDR